MREKTIRTIEENYVEMFQGYEVPAPIRRCTCLTMFRFAINGLCDGMYISNTIAVISGFGNGQGHFLECKRMPEKLAEYADEIATQIQFAYCSCIPEESKAELARMIKSQNLNDTETVHGMEELVANYKAEIKSCAEWRLWYLDAKVKQLEKNIALIKEDLSHIHRAEIRIDAANAADIRKVLTTEPKDESECFGEDEKISYTAVFDDGKEIDVQVCGVQYQDDGNNRPWTQAVLYDHGCEVACSDVEDGFFGEWELEHDGEIYIVTVSEAEIVVLEDAIDPNLRSELIERFNHALEEEDDELDFFMELVEAGFSLGDIRKYLPEKYEYSKTFMEDHGLI